MHRLPRSRRAANYLDRLAVIPFKNRRFWVQAALRRESDFGKVPADLRSPFWGGKTFFNNAPAALAGWRGAENEHLRQLQ